nr:hypothetical protein [Cylindrospermopsis raciborskii]
MGIKISDRHINRLLKQMGLSTRQKSKNNPEKNDPPQSEIKKLSNKSSIVIRDLPS